MAEISEMLSTVYGEDTLKPATLHKWVKHFQEGCEDIDDDVQRASPPPYVLKKMLIRYARLCFPIDK